MTKISDRQMEYYDRDFMIPKLWEIIERDLVDIFGQKPIRFLDIGGGNGLFSDKVLMAFKNASGVIIDNNEMILEQNKKNDRKKIVLCDSIDVHNIIVERNFDIVFFNWSLHHHVDRSFSKTIRKISQVLQGAKLMLKDDGFVFVSENCYESYTFNSIPSRLIYYISSNKLISPITRKIGVNTAGVGVCYLSKEMWGKVFSDVGFEVLSSKNIREHFMKDMKKWKGIALKTCLLCGKLYYTYFVLKKNFNKRKNRSHFHPYFLLRENKLVEGRRLP